MVSEFLMRFLRKKLGYNNREDLDKYKDKDKDKDKYQSPRKRQRLTQDKDIYKAKHKHKDKTKTRQRQRQRQVEANILKMFLSNCTLALYVLYSHIVVSTAYTTLG